MRYARMLVTLALAALIAGPAAATGPVVEAVAFGQREVRVYWEAQPGALGYRVERDGTAIGTVEGEAAPADGFSDRAVEPGRTYTYTVVARMPDGDHALPVPYVERTYPALPAETRCDVLVVGATTGGVAAAVASARYGLHVVLTEETRRLGGMPVNGLGSTDLRRLAHSSGMFDEFRRRVQTLYGAGDGLRYEPRVAQQAIKSMLWAEPNLTVYRELRPVRVVMDRSHGSRIAAVVEEDVSGASLGGAGRQVTFRAPIVIDATDCGDVAAWAGAPYRLGREPRTRREPHAGYIYYDRGHDRLLPGSTGRGDRRVQAYAYLMVVKDYGPGANRTIPRPPDYNPANYAHTPKWEQSWAVTSGRLPNSKYEVNQHPQGSDLQVVNYPYATASYAERRRIEESFRNHALGYLYYIQTVQGHPNIGLSEDDYRDSGGWPPLLYIREARRFIADRVLDETSIASRPLHSNAIGLGDYPMDSHAAEPKTDWDRPDMGEGEFYLPEWTPWNQAPLDIMIPKRVDNLFVPTAVSATHVAYGTLRLEPLRMQFGAAAGVAAYLCIRDHLTPAQVPARQVQSELLKHRAGTGAVPATDGIGGAGPSSRPALLFAFSDLQPGTADYGPAMWLAARGFYPAPPPGHDNPNAGLSAAAFGPDQPITTGEAERLLALLPRRAAWYDRQVPSSQFRVPSRAAAQIQSPLTRAAAARLITSFMGWAIEPAAPRTQHYLDVPPGSPDYGAVEALYDQWIDSRLWEAPMAPFAPDGKLYFRPDAPVTRAQFARLVWLCGLSFGPVWYDNPIDVAHM